MAADRVVLAVEVRDSAVGSGVWVLWPFVEEEEVASEVVVAVDLDVEEAEAEAVDLEAPDEAFVVAAAAGVVVEAEEDFFEAELDLAFDEDDVDTDSVLACFRAAVEAGSGLARLTVFEVDADDTGVGDDADDDVDGEGVDLRGFEESMATAL